MPPCFRTARRRCLVVGAALLGMVAAVLATARAAPEIDQPAPELKGRLFSGQAFDLAQLRGKVVLLNYYSSYCKFCAYEIGNLEAFYERHKGDGFEVIVLGVDEPADRARVERMLGIYNLPGTMAAETQQNGFGLRYPTPTAFVVDRAGFVRARHRGAKMPPFYREHILPLLRAADAAR